MTQASLLNPVHRNPAESSRLVRFIAELLDSNAQLSHDQFIERLGKSFDLADSIRISAVHEQTFQTAETAPSAEIKEIRDEFKCVHAAIVNSAVQSFSPEASAARKRFPQVRAGMTLEELTAVEPYLAFYVAQQRNIDFRIRDLHTSTRDAIAALSPHLAKLAALDAVLADPLAVPARRSFARVPHLLAQRFALLQEEHTRKKPEPSRARDCWELTLQQFRAEMQGLLLAEIETRLLPTQGLMHALDEFEEQDDY